MILKSIQAQQGARQQQMQIQQEQHQHQQRCALVQVLLLREKKNMTVNLPNTFLVSTKLHEEELVSPFTIPVSISV